MTTPRLPRNGLRIGAQVETLLGRRGVVTLMNRQRVVVALGRFLERREYKLSEASELLRVVS